MSKEDILKELHSIITEISILPVKSFDKFCEEHKGMTEKELSKLLNVGRQVLRMKDKK